MYFAAQADLYMDPVIPQQPETEVLLEREMSSEKDVLSGVPKA